MANKAITSRDVDFAKWYTDVVKAASRLVIALLAIVSTPFIIISKNI